MTPKHEKRILDLMSALEDYRHQAVFNKTDIHRDELNAIYALERRLAVRLQEPVDNE